MNAHFHDGEPRDVHPLSCALWTSSDPAVDCDCAESFEDGVERIVQLLESHGPARRVAS